MLGFKDPIQSLNWLSSAISKHNGQWHDPFQDALLGFEILLKSTMRDFKIHVHFKMHGRDPFQNSLLGFRIQIKIQNRISRSIPRCPYVVTDRLHYLCSQKCPESGDCNKASMIPTLRSNTGFQDPMQDPIQGFKIHFKMRAGV